MPYKRTATDDEIAVLAERLRPLWRSGDAVRPWLRKHGDLLINLVHDDWSWDGVAAALNGAGITYRTGNPWTGKRLNREYHRARAKPKRAVPSLKQEQAPTSAPPGVPELRPVSFHLGDKQPSDTPLALPPAQDEPVIKPASLRNWSGTPRKDFTPPTTTEPQLSEQEIDVAAEKARLFGDE